MPLHTLNLDNTQVTSLAPLSGLPLVALRAAGTRIEELDSLRGMKLELLSLPGCRNVKDLSPLAGMPLQKVDLSRTGITDLSPLVDSPIRELSLEGCAELVDLHPLMQMKKLESVIIPAHSQDIAFLRDHPGIEHLSFTRLTQTAEDFWKQWDAKQTPAAPPPP